MDTKIPIIIDCDPGIDDLIVLILAGRNKNINLKAITVVGGNQTLEKVGSNALKALSFLEVDVPVGYGYERPLLRDQTIASEVHGKDGIYGVELPESVLKPSQLHAIDLMAHILKKTEEKINLIATGPLTNIAMFLERYPELKGKIKKISLMGGAVNGGNRTKTAEFNIYVDPEAASIVFKSGLPIIMSGLDITQKAYLLKEDIRAIKKIDNRVSRFTVKLLERLLVIHKRTGFDGCYIHDPVALLALTNPDLIKTEALKVDIELKGEFTTGMTVAHRDKRFNSHPNADVGLYIDRESFVKEIIDTIKRY